jgi:hypothetical protein
VSEPPKISVLSQPQQLALLAKPLSRQIVKGVDLVSRRSNATKPGAGKFLYERGRVSDEKLDLHFFGHCHEEEFRSALRDGWDRV